MARGLGSEKLPDADLRCNADMEGGGCWDRVDWGWWGSGSTALGLDHRFLSHQRLTLLVTTWNWTSSRCVWWSVVVRWTRSSSREWKLRGGPSRLPLLSIPILTWPVSHVCHLTAGAGACHILSGANNSVSTGGRGLVEVSKEPSWTVLTLRKLLDITSQ